jgi:hypothetical protein
VKGASCMHLADSAALGALPICNAGQCGKAAGLTSRGLGAFLGPVPSLEYMSSALPALGKHSTRSLQEAGGRRAAQIGRQEISSGAGQA